MTEKRLPFFVYGTLRPGRKNYRRYFAGRTVRELPASVAGRLHFVRKGGYPYVLPGPGRVVGEVIVPVADHYPALLAAIDRLEDYQPEDERGSLYLRRQTMARLEDGAELPVWIYLWNGDPEAGEPVPGGDFGQLPAAAASEGGAGSREKGQLRGR